MVKVLRNQIGKGMAHLDRGDTFLFGLVTGLLAASWGLVAILLIPVWAAHGSSRPDGLETVRAGGSAKGWPRPTDRRQRVLASVPTRPTHRQ